MNSQPVLRKYLILEITVVVVVMVARISCLAMAGIYVRAALQEHVKHG
jgi:hypothetical protein